MADASIPTVVLVDKSRTARLPNRTRESAWSATGGWVTRIAGCVVLSFNFYVLNWVTCIAIFGWFYRWMQGITLRGWWKRSRFPQLGTFDEFTATLEKHYATSRPRCMIHERFIDRLIAPLRNGQPAGSMRILGRMCVLPFHSFWLNFKTGLQGLFATYLITGVPCLIMLFSWYFGWANSFYKVYEQAFLGPAIGIVGSLLLMFVLFYVPLAQAHQAASGQFRAFFQIRVVWRLMTTRMTAFAGLALLYFVVSIVLEGMRIAILSDEFFANDLSLTALQRYQYYRLYLLGCTVGLIGALFLLRYVTVVIYRSAVLKALRLGWIMPEDLPDNLRYWLEQLEIMPVPLARNTGVVEAGRVAMRWSYRRLLYVLIFLIWFVFVFRFYAGYFVVATDFLGFLNHPLFQFPCVDYTPSHLYDAAQG